MNQHDLTEASDMRWRLHHGGLGDILNASQQEAVAATLRHVVTVVHGPPGCGKTTVVDVIAAAHSPGADSLSDPVQVAAPSNAGADNALRRHALREGDETRPCRLGDPEKIEQLLLAYSLQEHAERSEGLSGPNKKRRTAALRKLRTCTAGFGTLEAAANLEVAGEDSLQVPAVIIDEAGQATEPCCVIVLGLLAAQGHLVLVGTTSSFLLVFSARRLRGRDWIAACWSG